MIEIAPGLIWKRIFSTRWISGPSSKMTPDLMDARIFKTEPMGLKDDLFTLPLEERLIYHPKENLFFVNFEGLLLL